MLFHSLLEENKAKKAVAEAVNNIAWLVGFISVFLVSLFSRFLIHPAKWESILSLAQARHP